MSSVGSPRTAPSQWSRRGSAAPRTPRAGQPARGAVAEPRSATTTRFVTTAPSRGVRVTSGSTGRSWRSSAPAAAAARSRLPAAVWCTASANSTSLTASYVPATSRSTASSRVWRSPVTCSCASSWNHCWRGQQLEQPEAVDDVAGGHRLDRRVEVAGAGLQRRGDPEADDQVGQAGVGQPALDPVAEQRGERLAGGDALEQLQRLAHARRRQVEVERILGAVGLPAAAQQRRG